MLAFALFQIHIASMTPSATVEKMRSELSSLSQVERAELAHFLIQSLDRDTDHDAEAAWDEELTRRAAEIKNGKAKGEPAEKVFTELRAKYS